MSNMKNKIPKTANQKKENRACPFNASENLSPSISADDFLDGAYILALLDISKGTLQKWRDKRVLKFYRIGGKFYYTAKDIYEAAHMQRKYLRNY